MWCSAADTQLKVLDRVVSGAYFLTGVCLNVILLIVDLWQYCVCCIRSGVIRCTLFMVLYLSRMCQCGLHSLLCSYIGILNYAPPRSTVWPVFPSHCPSGTILGDALVDWFSYPCIQWYGTGGFQEQGQGFFIILSCSIPFGLLLFFSFLFFLSMGWYCGAGVFGLIGCRWLSPSLALPTRIIILTRKHGPLN